MKKLSFSLPSKPSSSSSKPKPSTNFSDDTPSPKNHPNHHEYLSEFDPSKTLTLNSAPKKIIIPPKQNEWRPSKRMKNLDLPPLQSNSSNFEFEVESADIVDPGAQVSYGLNLRQSNGNVNNSSASSSNSIDALMLRNFKNDIERLPEVEGFDDFNDVPVDGFGAALLAGYGWVEGRGIGKNAKDDVKVVEYKRRTAKEGLGFTADHPPPPAAKIGSDKGKENGKNIEKSEGLGCGVGKEVRIVSGKEMGLKGRVVEGLEGGMMVLMVLDGDKEEREVRVRVEEVAALGSVEEDKCLRKLKELRIPESRDDSRRSEKKSKDRRSRDEGRKGGNGEIKHDRLQREERRGSRVSWLTSHIRVRIISKEFKGGMFYLKKGKIVDVVGPGLCDISMDDGQKIVQGVQQDILETALPRRGGPVLVLLGKHKGAYGSLVEKDTERETGVVQDADTRELLNVRLEQIAEYIGDPSYLGY